MSKKTRKQRKLEGTQKSKSAVVNTASTSVVAAIASSEKPVSKYNKGRYEYKETDYDQALRKFTIRDIIKTSGIIIALFVLQYVIYLNFAPGK